MPRDSSMSGQQLILWASLRAAGWRLADRQTSDLSWWAAEVWSIESEWRPVGLPAYLIFLRDELAGLLGRKPPRGTPIGWIRGTATWSDEASAAPIAEVSYRTQHFPEFLGRLAEFRDQTLTIK